MAAGWKVQSVLGEAPAFSCVDLGGVMVTGQLYGELDRSAGWDLAATACGYGQLLRTSGWCECIAGYFCVLLGVFNGLLEKRKAGEVGGEGGGRGGGISA